MRAEISTAINRRKSSSAGLGIRSVWNRWEKGATSSFAGPGTYVFVASPRHPEGRMDAQERSAIEKKKGFEITALPTTRRFLTPGRVNFS